MSKMMLTAALAAVTLGGALAGAAPAQAQVGLEIGPRGLRAVEDRPYRPVIERRERRVIVEDDAEECRVVVRRSVNRFGERVVRRTRVCD